MFIEDDAQKQFVRNPIQITILPECKRSTSLTAFPLSKSSSLLTRSDRWLT